MEKINAVITGVGGYVPKYILDNDEMSRIVDTTDEWIMERIGVKTRHILRDEERQGVFVAGDCRSKTVRQLTTAAGDGAAAALAACRFIDSL